MASRYVRVYVSHEKLYIAESPVVVEAHALLKDNANGKILAQVKLQNISGNSIIACKMNIRAFELNGTEVEGVSEFAYLDMNVNPYEEFGTKTPIYLPAVTARRIKISVTEVVFSDGAIWEKEPCEWMVIPQQERISAYLSNKALIKQYELEAGGNCTYVPAIFQDLFQCTCGAVTQVSHGRCHNCGREYSSLKNALDEGNLNEKLAARLRGEEEKQRAEAEAAARAAEEARLTEEKERAVSEKKKIKRKKRMKISAIFIALIVIMGLCIWTEINKTRAVCDEYLKVLDEQTSALLEDNSIRENHINEIAYNVSGLKRAGFGKDYSAEVTITCNGYTLPVSEDDVVNAIREYIPEEVELSSGNRVLLTNSGGGNGDQQKEMLTIFLDGEIIYGPKEGTL